MQVVQIGLDLAKYVFEVHGVDERGNVVMRKTLRRGSVSASRMAVSSLHGWGLYQSSGQVAGETDCSASANAAIAICAR